jgi:hypothetical protein
MLVAAKRGKGRPFQKGVSGNPSGKAINNPELRAINANLRKYAQTFTKEALDKIVSCLRGEAMRVGVDAKGKDIFDYPGVKNQLEAAVHLLDRGHGRPSQAIDVVSEEQLTVTHVSGDDLIDLISSRIDGIRERLRDQGVFGALESGSKTSH